MQNLEKNCSFLSSGIAPLPIPLFVLNITFELEIVQQILIFGGLFLIQKL